MLSCDLVRGSHLLRFSRSLTCRRVAIKPIVRYISCVFVKLGNGRTTLCKLYAVTWQLHAPGCSKFIARIMCREQWTSERFFPGREGIVDFSRGSQNGPKMVKFHFFPVETKKTISFAENLIGKCQILKSVGVACPLFRWVCREHNLKMTTTRFAGKIWVIFADSVRPCVYLIKVKEPVWKSASNISCGL